MASERYIRGNHRKRCGNLLAEVDHNIIGFIIANLCMGLQKAIIENVYVASGHRDGGIGDKLLSKLLDALQETPIEYIATLIPSDAHNAARLYEAAGFSKGETFLWLDKSITKTFTSE